MTRSSHFALLFAIALAAVSTVVLTSGVAFASGDASEHHGIDGKKLALQIFNFALLIFILAKFGGSAVNKFLKTRHEQFKTDMDGAARARAAAEERFQQQEQRLANLEQEIASMREAIRKEAAQEQERMVLAAAERARRIQRDTKFQLDQQVKEAELRFRQQMAAAAIKVAEEALKSAVSASDEQRLVHGFLNDLAMRPATTGDGARSAGTARRVSTSEETVG